MSALITIKNLSCERDERVLFEGLSDSFKSGEIVQIYGPNGAGKTTLLKILTGLSSIYEGEILFQGAKHRGYEYYSSLLYLGHLPAVKTSLTPFENLSWYFGINGTKQEGTDAAQIPSAETLTRALETVGLRGYESTPCYQMSAGQQRRVALARLYCSKAKVWILDEPFTAIDKSGVAKLEEKINDHASQGGLVILTTHQALNLDHYRVLDVSEFAPAGSKAVA